MVLTKKNMRTDPTGNTVDFPDFYYDITHMSESQLEKYVRMAFTGERDEKFLPYPFWHYVFSSYSLAARAPSAPEFPGEFFARLYTTIPSMLAGKFTAHNKTTIDVNPNYRKRLENILKEILLGCINHKGKLTPNEFLLAYGSVDALREIKGCDGTNSPEKQFAAVLEEKESATILEAREIAQRLKFPDDNKNELFSLVKELKKDNRYSNINYRFF